MNAKELSGFGYFKKVVTEHYADFDGRARRSEYWYFLLFNIVIMIPLYIVGIIGAASETLILSILGFGLYGLVALALIIPSIAVVVRRLHDTGRSGWYYLMAFIPLVGGIILIVFLVEDSKPGSNKWGANPKEVSPTNDVIDHLQA